MNEFDALFDKLMNIIEEDGDNMSDDLNKLNDEIDEIALDRLEAAIIEDYNAFCANEDMQAEFAKNLGFNQGQKYTKVVSGGSVWGFIVDTDDDKKFKRGDILKAASWSSPARNQARGNIYAENYTILWTGPLYLR